MTFEIPELGSQQMLDLLCRLDRAQHENADAFVVVAIDDDTGEVAEATGPFTQPEQALANAGRQDTDWKSYAEPEEGSWTYKVVPLWKAE